jgi:hypothetical protein
MFPSPPTTPAWPAARALVSGSGLPTARAPRDSAIAQVTLEFKPQHGQIVTIGIPLNPDARE